MKRILLVSAFLITVLSCQESRDQQSPNTYRRDIGQAIPTDVAYRWVNQGGGTEARTNLHALPAAQLHDLLPSTTGFVGVTLHHAVDNTGAYHILVTPVQEDGALWAIEKIWDATGKQWVESGVAESWAKRFSETNPAIPHYHFFGSNLFDVLLSNQGLDIIEIVPAMNDDQEPQLLLFAWSVTSEAGRTQGSAALTVYDASRPCPPCSATN